MLTIDKLREFACLTHSKIIEIKGAGHFNAASGYTEFPNIIEEIIQKN